MTTQERRQFVSLVAKSPHTVQATLSELGVSKNHVLSLAG